MPACSHCLSLQMAAVWIARTQTGLDGRYLRVSVSSALTCSPASLPAPSSSDASQYIRTPVLNQTDTAVFDVRQSGDSLYETPINSAGQMDTAHEFVGVVDGNGSFTSHASSHLTEGARAGGHTFDVTGISTSTGLYMSLKLLLPGNDSQIALSAATSTSYTFREGGPGGPIFTVCSVSGTVNGSRITKA